jgi:hypothetical protein
MSLKLKGKAEREIIAFSYVAPISGIKHASRFHSRFVRSCRLTRNLVGGVGSGNCTGRRHDRRQA